MIFRFPASLNLDALGLTPYGLMIAKAIQDYGMVLTDTSEIAPEPAGHGLPLSKCEAYNRVYEQSCGSS